MTERNDDLENLLSGAKILDMTGYAQRFEQLKTLGFQPHFVGRLSELLHLQAGEQWGITTMPDHLKKELEQLRRQVREKIQQQ